MRKKLLLILILVAILLVTGGVLLLNKKQVNAEIGNLQVFKGSAQVTRTGKTENGSTGMPVQVNDRIKVASGSTVAIVLKDNTIIRLEGGSEAEIGELTYENGKIKEAAIKLTNGRAWSRVKPLENGSNFEVETPTITAAVRGTSFNTTFKNEISGIYVYQSAVEATLNKTGGKQGVEQSQLLQMQQDSLEKDFKEGSETPPQDFFDEWIKFNQAEDDKLCRELHDIPGCDSVGLAVVNAEVTPAPAPTPTPAPPPSTPKRRVTPPPPPPPQAPTVQSITVNCSYSQPNATGQCSAVAHMSNGQTLDVTTNKASWTLQLHPPNNQVNGTIGATTGYYSGQGDDYAVATYGGETGSYLLPPNNW